MATATKISLRSDTRAQFRVAHIADESAAQATQLLQKNHDENDIIFTDAGVHNHIVHHILTTSALGATPDSLQKHYAENANYQRPPRKLDEEKVSDLKDPQKFIANLKQTESYRNYMVFFQREIERNSYQEVLQEYLFKGDERANIIFNRTVSGFYHPLIHLGFGVEFEQPAIIAEALGLAAIHPPFEDPFFKEADRKAKTGSTESAHLIDICEQLAKDDLVKNSTKWEDGNRIRDGVMVRAADEMTDYASMWRVGADELEEKLAETTNFAALLAGSSQHPPKQIKFDFYFMHAMNSTVFFADLLKKPWISNENKAKLLEWKGRYDLLLFTSRGSPALLKEEITGYKLGKLKDGEGLFERANAFADDGHASKLVRAFANGQRVCAPFEGRGCMPVEGEMWLQLGNMAMDSCEDSGEQWVRSAGFEQAWEKYSDRVSE